MCCKCTLQLNPALRRRPHLGVERCGPQQDMSRQQQLGQVLAGSGELEGHSGGRRPPVHPAALGERARLLGGQPRRKQHPQGHGPMARPPLAARSASVGCCPWPVSPLLANSFRRSHTRATHEGRSCVFTIHKASLFCIKQDQPYLHESKRLNYVIMTKDWTKSPPTHTFTHIPAPPAQECVCILVW